MCVHFADFKLLTAYCYFVACFINFVTSLHLLNMGYVEHKVLYSLLGSAGFWILYVGVSAGLLILLLVASKKWWWAYLLLWIPTIVHVVCGSEKLWLLL